ncbi:hypothetical protein FB446DRAFT_829186, partial [Lentinula raphanica]
MAHALRPDIPSRRTRNALGQVAPWNALSQVAPGLADLNPVPRAGQDGPPPLGTLDRAPAGSFQSNRPLNGERGVAARQQARLRNSVSSVQPESAPRSSPREWDSNAFPTDLDLFGEDTGGGRDSSSALRHPGGRALPSRGSPHSARPRHGFGSEGRGAGVSRGEGPIAPDSSGSDGAPPVWWCGSPQGSSALRGGVMLGLLVPWLDSESGHSEWGGIVGELRVYGPPPLGPPIELRSTRVDVPAHSESRHVPVGQQRAFATGVEEYRSTSRSQSRQEHLELMESPAHEKVGRLHPAVVASPRRMMSLEDGGRATVRYGDHSRRRSKSAEPMDVDPGAAGGNRTRSLAFPDPRTARYLTADPVGMLTSVNPVVSRVLSEGWQEPIPLGHFARRYNPLISGIASGDLSTLRMGENGQVQVHHRRLRDIPLDDLTESDWYQIKQNFPCAVVEFLIPPGQRRTGSKVALATAKMIHNLFTLMEERDRFSKEITPIFYYVDHKIRWWRAHSFDNIRVDTVDKDTFESIYREWKEREELKEKEAERLAARERFPGRRGGFSGSGSSSHFGGGGEHEASSHHGSRGGRGFGDRHAGGSGRCPTQLGCPRWDVPMAWEVPCGMSLWPGRSHVGCPYDLGCPRWDVLIAWAVPGKMLLWPGMSHVGCPYGCGMSLWPGMSHVLGCPMWDI